MAQSERNNSVKDSERNVNSSYASESFTLANWRGIYGPPDMPQAAVAYWQKALDEMVKTPTWKQIAARRQFTTTFMIGDEFATFLAKTQADVKAALEQAAK